MKKLLETVRENICVRRILLFINAFMALIGTVAWTICYFADMSIARYWEGIAVCAYCNILLNTNFYWKELYNITKRVRKED